LGTLTYLAVALFWSSADWQEFAPPEGRFRVELPGQPRQQTETQSSPTGPVRVTRFDLGRKREDISYSIAYMDFSDEAMKQVQVGDRFRAARDGALAKIPGAQLESEGSCFCDTYYGYEVIAAAPDKGRFTLRVYAVGNRFYLLTAAGKGVQSSGG